MSCWYAASSECATGADDTAGLRAAGRAAGVSFKGCGQAKAKFGCDFAMGDASVQCFCPITCAGDPIRLGGVGVGGSMVHKHAALRHSRWLDGSPGRLWLCAVRARCCVAVDCAGEPVTSTTPTPTPGNTRGRWNWVPVWMDWEGGRGRMQELDILMCSSVLVT